MFKAIEAIKKELTRLRDQTAQEIEDIHADLSKPGGKSKLRPLIVVNKGYSTFSIIWQRLVFYNFTSHRAILKRVRKGRGFLVSKFRLLSRCKDCEEWETNYIWEKEQKFGRVRKQVALLSQGVSALKQYCALGQAAPPEQLDSAVKCLEMQECIDNLTEGFKDLKERTCQQVADVSSRLNGRLAIRLIAATGKGFRFTVEWFNLNGGDPDTGQSVEHQIPREGKYSMRRSRLLAHCRSYEEQDQEYIWAQEQEFARVRQQVDLLIQAITALQRYAKEAAAN